MYRCIRDEFRLLCVTRHIGIAATPGTGHKVSTEPTVSVLRHTCRRVGKWRLGREGGWFPTSYVHEVEVECLVFIT